MVGVTLMVCLTVIAIAYRAELLIGRWLALREFVAQAEATPAPRAEATSIPGDLYALAQSYEDEWAREDALKAMRELYGESGSWDVVRVSYGINRTERK